MSSSLNLVNGFDRFTTIAKKHWVNIERAKEATKRTHDELTRRVVLDTKSVPSDSSLVVFGSLARGDWTDDSDLDWTLLVDGHASPDHFNLATDLKMQLSAIHNQPGKTATFGTTTFSHDLVHYIGGDEDTNKNTTRR